MNPESLLRYTDEQIDAEVARRAELRRLEAIRDLDLHIGSLKQQLLKCCYTAQLAGRSFAFTVDSKDLGWCKLEYDKFNKELTVK